MAFVDDQDPVEQFAAQGSNHPFADRVRPERSGRIGQDLNAVGGEDRVERPGESGVSVSEQERDGGGAVGAGRSSPRSSRQRRYARSCTSRPTSTATRSQ
jgi:hypothetical protein